MANKSFFQRTGQQFPGKTRFVIPGRIDCKIKNITGFAGQIWHDDYSLG